MCSLPVTPKRKWNKTLAVHLIFFCTRWFTVRWFHVTMVISSENYKLNESTCCRFRSLWLSYFLACQQGALWTHDQDHVLMSWSFLHSLLFFCLRKLRWTFLLFVCLFCSHPIHQDGSVCGCVFSSAPSAAVCFSVYFHVSFFIIFPLLCVLYFSLSLSFFFGLMAEVHNKWEVY